METKTIEIYKFDELDEKAKDVARNWFRDWTIDWWDAIYEDARGVGLEIKSFDINRFEIDFVFSESAMATARLIVKNHGANCDTFNAAKFFMEKIESVNRKIKKLEIEESFVRRLKAVYLHMLKDECEYQYSDECVDEGLLANEFEFLASGNLAP